MKLYAYGNYGGIDKVIEDINNNPKTFDSIEKLFIDIERFFNGDICMNDLSVAYYGYDERIKKTVYLILTNKMGTEDYIKKYGSRKYVAYVIDIEEDINDIERIDLEQEFYKEFIIGRNWCNQHKTEQS